MRKPLCFECPNFRRRDRRLCKIESVCRTFFHTMKITDLKTEYFVNPLGIDTLKPRFFWCLQSDRNGARQIAYRLRCATSEALIATPDLGDSGRVETSKNAHIEYAMSPLRPRQRVFWQVEIEDETGAQTNSEIAWFETGLMGETLSGQWIGSALSGGTQNSAPCPFLRKDFTIKKTVMSARLYATALGLYEYSINGQRVGDDVFTPGWTDYNTRVQYQTYDVTQLLQGGNNACGAILGDGWYCGHVEWRGRQRYGDRPKLRAELLLTFEDGSTQSIGTDESWKYAFGPILESDMLMGEHYDARREMPGWNTATFDDAEWAPVRVFDAPKIEICASSGPTVCVHEMIKPVALKTLPGSPVEEFVFDMAQNMVGCVRLKLRGKAGATVRLRFAEVVNVDGTLYIENLRSARATDYYTFKSDEIEEWEPRFTFHGFRYVEVSGLELECDLESVTGLVYHSDIKRIGEWSSDNALLNQLQHNIWWGQKGNFLEVPTDCPQRDERLGWTGDAQVFARTAAFNADIAGFFAKWQRDIRDAQFSNGGVPCVVPNTGPIAGDEDGGPAWSDATIICPWTMYLCYGDERVLEENYDVFVRYIQHLDDLSRPFGMIRAHPECKAFAGFGDWLSTDTPDAFGTTRKDLIGTAFFAHSTRILAKIARVLGKTDDAETYEKLFEKIKAAFNARFVTPDGLVSGNTQTSNVLALHFDLMPQNRRATALDELVCDIKKRGNHLSVGFVGSPYIAQVLSDNGRADVAFELLHQTAHPSWLYAVTQGATTIWERWDGWTHDKGFQDKSMNSFNHYAYGAIGAWMYAKVAGIEIDENAVGYEHILFKPLLDPTRNLNAARAVLQSLRGEIVSDWKLEGEKFSWKIVVPPNAHASVFVPTNDALRVLDAGRDARETLRFIGETEGYSHFEVGAGTYQFSSTVAPSE